MPKRRVPDEQLHGLRVELNTRERDLLEQAIYVNGAAKTLQGAGNAISGLGLGFGIFAAAVVFIEGVETVTDWFKQDREEWERENLTLDKYNAYLMIRTGLWITAAKKAGRYGPAVGDAEHPEWSRNMHAEDVVVGGVTFVGSGQPALTFEEWELTNYPDDPPMTFAIWSNAMRAQATRERERKLGYGWLKDITEWVGGYDPEDPTPR